MARRSHWTLCTVAVLLLSLALRGVWSEPTSLHPTEQRRVAAQAPRFELAHGGLLELEEREGAPALNLRAGSLHVHPSTWSTSGRSATARRLIVRTSDVEIEAAAASAFTVEVVGAGWDCDGIDTRIAVSAGSVLVRCRSKTLTLLDGQRWPRCVALDAATDP